MQERKENNSKQQHTPQKLNINSNNNNNSHKRETSSTKQIMSSKEQVTDDDKEHNKDNKMLKSVPENGGAGKGCDGNTETIPYKPIMTKSNVLNVNHRMLNLTRVEHNKRFESKIESKEFQKNLTNIIKQSFTQKEVSESDDDDD